MTVSSYLTVSTLFFDVGGGGGMKFFLWFPVGSLKHFTVDHEGVRNYFRQFAITFRPGVVDTL